MLNILYWLFTFSNMCQFRQLKKNGIFTHFNKICSFTTEIYLHVGLLIDSNYIRSLGQPRLAPNRICSLNILQRPVKC